MDTSQSFAKYGAHWIDVTFDAKGKSIVSHLGVEIGATRHGAIYLAARWLLSEGRAEPFHRIATYVDGIPSMSGRVGACASWTVREDDEVMKLVRYREPNFDKMRLAGAA